MNTSLARRSGRVTQYEVGQRIRRKLMEQGVEPWRVSSTPTAGLPALVREVQGVQLRLVPDVEETPDVPRLGVKLTEEQKRVNRHAECDQDELASIATFARGELAETRFPSADLWTPWDEFDPKDAA